MTNTNSHNDAPYAALLITALSMRPFVPKKAELPSRNVTNYIAYNSIAFNLVTLNQTEEAEESFQQALHRNLGQHAGLAPLALNP